MGTENKLGAGDSEAIASFVSTAVNLLQTDGETKLKEKLGALINSLSDSEKIILWEKKLENPVINELKNELIKEYFIVNNQRKKEYKFCPSCATPLTRKTIGRGSFLSCPKCGFVFWNNPKPVVSVILEKEGQILLIKRAKKPLKDYWCMPGGFVEYAEKPKDAAVREALEETGLETELRGLVGVYQIDNDPKGINLDIIYFGEIRGGSLKLSEEHVEYKYFSLNELPELIAYKHRQAIEDWTNARKLV
ncbi:NUDIX hydrolase [Candidatus Micrarchaeota archaeon]|nr:NUDIX hydrolase [Candidatus Micrarchaeota archaeon]